MADMLISHQIHDDVLQILQSVHDPYPFNNLLFAFKSRADETVADFTCLQVKMLEDRRRRSQVVVVQLDNRQTEESHSFPTVVETGLHGIMVIDPLLNAILYIEGHHASATD